jgi:protein O-mannosyl-transferase
MKKMAPGASGAHCGSPPIADARSERLLGLNPSRVIEMGLVALTAIVYTQVWNFGLIMFDDPQTVGSNAHVRSGMTLEGIEWAFGAFHFANWIPLTWVSLMLDASLFGDRPGGFHITNVLLHLANVLLLFHLFRRSTGRLWPSALVAALFAVQPIHAESVVWITERKDVLSLFFGLLAMNVYVSYARQRRVPTYLIALACFVCSLLAKQTLVTLPFVLLLLDYWPLGRFGSRPFWSLVFEKVPYFVISAVLCYVTLLAQREGFAALPLQQGAPFYLRVSNALVVYVLYIVKASFPFYLGLLYPFPTDISLLTVAAATVVLVAVTIFAVGKRSEFPYVLVGWLWYLGALVPMIGLVKVGRQQMADRYAYFPFIGLYLAIAWLVPVLVRSRTWRTSLATFALVFYTVTGFVQVSYWREGLTLMRHTCAVVRDDWSLHLGLSEELAATGRIEQALDELRQGVQVSPQNPEAHWRLGHALLRNRRYEEAERAYRQALALDKNNIAALNGLGETLAITGRLTAAKREFARALELEKGVHVTYVNLAYVCQRMGDYDESNQYCAIALELDNDLLECRRIMQINNQLLGRGRSSPTP